MTRLIIYPASSFVNYFNELNTHSEVPPVSDSSCDLHVFFMFFSASRCLCQTFTRVLFWCFFSVRTQHIKAPLVRMHGLQSHTNLHCYSSGRLEEVLQSRILSYNRGGKGNVNIVSVGKCQMQTASGTHSGISHRRSCRGPRPLKTSRRPNPADL